MQLLDRQESVGPEQHPKSVALQQDFPKEGGSGPGYQQALGKATPSNSTRHCSC
jgi:hypothetical protein